MSEKEKRKQVIRKSDVKVKALDMLRTGMKKAEVSRALSIPESTIRGWVKTELTIRIKNNSLIGEASTSSTVNSAGTSSNNSSVRHSSPTNSLPDTSQNTLPHVTLSLSGRPLSRETLDYWLQEQRAAVQRVVLPLESTPFCLEQDRNNNRFLLTKDNAALYYGEAFLQSLKTMIERNKYFQKEPPPKERKDRRVDGLQSLLLDLRCEFFND